MARARKGVDEEDRKGVVVRRLEHINRCKVMVKGCACVKKHGKKRVCIYTTKNGKIKVCKKK